MLRFVQSGAGDGTEKRDELNHQVGVGSLFVEPAVSDELERTAQFVVVRPRRFEDGGRGDVLQAPAEGDGLVFGIELDEEIGVLVEVVDGFDGLFGQGRRHALGISEAGDVLGLQSAVNDPDAHFVLLAGGNVDDPALHAGDALHVVEHAAYAQVHVRVGESTVVQFARREFEVEVLRAFIATCQGGDHFNGGVATGVLGVHHFELGSEGANPVEVRIVENFEQPDSVDGIGIRRVHIVDLQQRGMLVAVGQTEEVVLVEGDDAGRIALVEKAHEFFVLVRRFVVDLDRFVSQAGHERVEAGEDGEVGGHHGAGDLFREGEEEVFARHAEAVSSVGHVDHERGEARDAGGADVDRHGVQVFLGQQTGSVVAHVVQCVDDVEGLTVKETADVHVPGVRVEHGAEAQGATQVVADRHGDVAYQTAHDGGQEVGHAQVVAQIIVGRRIAVQQGRLMLDEFGQALRRQRLEVAGLGIAHDLFDRSAQLAGEFFIERHGGYLR